jgi:hypothetical protein
MLLSEIDHPGLSNPDSACGQLQRTVLAFLNAKREKEEIPTNIRFVFYELEQQGKLSKHNLNLNGTPSKRKPAQNLTDAITHLRKVGAIPWDWIIDESREVTEWRRAPSVLDYAAESAHEARIDPWLGTVRPVLLTEARTTWGVFKRTVAGEYLVDGAATGGQCHGFLVTNVATLLVGEDTRVLYVGDFDDAGDDIEANTRAVLERHAKRTFDEDTWERVALTEAQTKMLKARGVQPVEKKDERYRDGNPHFAYEAEAIGQGPITDMLRQRLEELIPEPLEDVLEREVAQRAEVVRLLSRRPRRE